MQGRKTFEEEKELLFSLSAHVPAHNFYRRLKDRGAPEGFTYEKAGDFFLCPEGKKAVFCQQISKAKGGRPNTGYTGPPDGTAGTAP